MTNNFSKVTPFGSRNQVRYFVRRKLNQRNTKGGAHTVELKNYRSTEEFSKFFNSYGDFKTSVTKMFSITTINHRTSDVSHPLIMITNRQSQRYFFGKVPEGTQRLLNENKFRLTKLKGIFLTGTLNTWSEIGGLPGLFLTIGDTTIKNVEVYSTCTKILNYIVATWRYFVFRKGVTININDVSDTPEPFIGDSSVMVKPIKVSSTKPVTPIEDESKISRQLKKLVSLMFPLDTSSANNPDPDSYKSDPNDSDIQNYVSVDDIDIQTFSSNQKSLNYLIRFVPIRGKFDVAKAKQLNIKPGQLYRELTQGNPVMNENNEMIYPHQVLGEDQHFQKVLILDIPHNNYLDNTINQNWTPEDFGDEEIGLVYHLLGDDIDFTLEKYMNFIKTFPSQCKHVINHKTLADDCISFKTFSVHLLKLRSLQSNHFNLPYSETYKPLPANDHNIIKLHQLQNIEITPKDIKIDDSQIFKKSWSDIYDENIEPLNLKVQKEQVIDPEPLSLGLVHENLKDNVQITTLGTGSSLPAIDRNVISNLVRIPIQSNGQITFKSAIFDGGENTFGGLLRTFGHDGQWEKILKELGLIFLSHLHADHHLGIISIINEWFKVNTNDEILHLVLPWQYSHFLNEWYKLEAIDVDLSRINFISCEDFLRNRTSQYKKFSMDEFEEKFDNGLRNTSLEKEPLSPVNTNNINKLYQDLNIVRLDTCRAIHCFWSYSVSVTFQLNESETFKVSYSGDTRPNPKFIDIGYNSDVLIHESSLNNELIEEALAKKHSTMIEAINVSRYMNCPRLILTHFSTRFSSQANFIEGEEHFTRLSNELKNYLNEYNSRTNIYTLEEKLQRPVKQFKDLDIAFAFDSYITRLNEVGDQKNVLDLLNELFEPDDEKDTLKELKRIEMKRQDKRNKRLELQKKRKHDNNDS